MQRKSFPVLQPEKAYKKEMMLADATKVILFITFTKDMTNMPDASNH